MKIGTVGVSILGVALMAAWFLVLRDQIPSLRLLKKSFAGREGVGSVCFSHDGEFFFVGGTWGFQKWDARKIKRLSEHAPVLNPDSPEMINNVKHDVMSMVCHPTKPFLYLGGAGKKVIVWNYETNQEIDSIPKKNNCWTNLLAIDASGKFLAIAENSKIPKDRGPRYEIIIWDLDEDKEHRRLQVNCSPMEAIAFADGPIIAVDSMIGPVKIFDAESGTRVATLEEKIFDAETGALMKNLGNREDELGLYGIGQNSDTLAYIPGKKRLIVEKELWDTNTWTRIRDLFPDTLRGISLVTTDGKYGFIRLAPGGKIGVVDMATEKIIAEAEQYSNHGIDCLAISPDGKTLVTGGYGRRYWQRGSTDETDRDLCIWRVNVD